jgi:hypothetical protein
MFWKRNLQHIPKENRVNDAKNGRVDANAERERQECNAGENRDYGKEYERRGEDRTASGPLYES